MAERREHLERFAAELRSRMSLLGVSTIELAGAVDVNRVTISAWRNAQSDPDLVPLLRAESYLGMEPGDLAGHIDVGDVGVAASAGHYAARDAERRRAEIDALIDEPEDRGK